MVIAGRKANRLFKARFPHPSHLSASPTLRGAGLSCGRCLRRVAWEPSGLRSTAWPAALACSSMALALPGLAAPLVVGGL